MPPIGSECVAGVSDLVNCKGEEEREKEGGVNANELTTAGGSWIS